MRNVIFRRKILYLPVVTIIALTITLTTILAISTYRNMQRDRQGVNRHIALRSKFLFQSFDERAVSEISLGLLESLPWQECLQRLVVDMSNDSTVEYIFVADQDGNVIVHSNRDKVGTRIQPIFPLKGRLVMDVTSKQKIFEIATPLKFTKNRILRKIPVKYINTIDERIIENGFSGYWVLVGLKVKEFEAIHVEDASEIIIMGAIILIIGSASLYLIVVIQNYYLVNQTLNNMRTYTQNIVESMVNGLISVDESGIVTTINPMATRIIGIDRENAEGQHVSRVMESKEFDIQELLTSDRHIVDREITLHSDGNRIPLGISGSQLTDETGKVMGAVIIIRDLREIRELQEKVRRAENLASLGRLAAGVAHEIRNPLSSIRGFAQYFKGKFEPQTKDIKYATAMVEEIDRLDRIIEALLDFARPTEPELMPHRIEDILDHTLQLIQSDVNMKGVNVSKHIQESLSETMIDRDQIIQAILNILLNALEAVDKDGDITISAFTKEDNLHIVISDTGKGIPEEDRQKIFDPFFSTKKDGTGLGLAIVHRIVENHKGEIRVESILGAGTTFTIVLPMELRGKENA